VRGFEAAFLAAGLPLFAAEDLLPLAADLGLPAVLLREADFAFEGVILRLPEVKPSVDFLVPVRFAASCFERFIICLYSHSSKTGENNNITNFGKMSSLLDHKKLQIVQRGYC
jgi:hypothetical protein